MAWNGFASNAADQSSLLQKRKGFLWQDSVPEGLDLGSGDRLTGCNQKQGFQNSTRETLLWFVSDGFQRFREIGGGPKHPALSDRDQFKAQPFSALGNLRHDLCDVGIVSQRSCECRPRH